MNLPLRKPLTYLITEGDTDSGNFRLNKRKILERVRWAAEELVSLIQIREKNLPSLLLFDLAGAAAKITGETDTRLLINGRADIALAAGADGVHLPADGLSAAVVRQRFPSDFLIGVSTHSVEEALAAKATGADFITFGPVFESPGKGTPQGLEALNCVCRFLDPFPVIALGGIDESNYANVLERGASGFAAIRFLNDQNKLRKLTLNR